MNLPDYSPEYHAYAKAHGRTPDDQMAHDRVEYPGGCICGFILWMSERLASFRRAHPEAHIGDRISDHAAKIRFLQETP